MDEQIERAIEITGGSAETLAEALDQWEAERTALQELFDENQALILSFRRYDVAMSLAERVIAQVEKDAGMFITQPTRDKIEQFRKQMHELEERRAHDQNSVADSTNRRHNVKTSVNP